MTEGNQPQLYQCLEAVADAQHQAVPLAQQFFHLLGDEGVAEEAGDELAAAVGLVAAGEAAGDHDNLALTNGLCKSLDGFLDLVGVAVTHHKHLRQSTSPFKDPGGVVLAVGAREHRDQHPGLGHLNSGGRTVGLVEFVADGVNTAGRRFDLHRVHRLQLLFIGFFHVV